MDDEGREILKFKVIIDHKKYGSVLTKETCFTVIKVGHKKCKPTTRGWKVLMNWRYEKTTWTDIKYIKEASPIELDEYAVAKTINYEADFAWWVNYVFKKLDRIIAKDKTKYWRTTHKYGVRLPKTTAESLELDRQIGQPLWVII